MKYFIVTDVHGFFGEMMEALDKVGFDKNNPEHFFVSLGDLLDRGSYPKMCLDFVNSLERKILIRGNHEDLMETMISNGFAKWHDEHNGTFQTAMALCPKGYSIDFDKLRNYEPLQTYLNSVIPYYETKTAIFTHGWIPCGVYSTYDEGEEKKVYEYYPNWRDFDEDTRQVYNSRWVNGMDAWQNGVREDGKTIYCGHWNSSWGNYNFGDATSEFGEGADFSPFIADGIVAMDACTAYSKKVNCIVLEED